MGINLSAIVMDLENIGKGLVTDEVTLLPQLLQDVFTNNTAAEAADVAAILGKGLAASNDFLANLGFGMEIHDRIKSWQAGLNGMMTPSANVTQVWQAGIVYRMQYEWLLGLGETEYAWYALTYWQVLVQDAENRNDPNLATIQANRQACVDYLAALYQVPLNTSFGTTPQFPARPAAFVTAIQMIVAAMPAVTAPAAPPANEQAAAPAAQQAPAANAASPAPAAKATAAAPAAGSANAAAHQLSAVVPAGGTAKFPAGTQLSGTLGVGTLTLEGE